MTISEQARADAKTFQDDEEAACYGTCCGQEAELTPAEVAWERAARDAGVRGWAMTSSEQALAAFRACPMLRGE